MLILAIDTALAACSAAVFDAATDELLASESPEMQRGHAEALMPLIVRVMDAARLDFADLDRIAVTVGPGSFTGLRVGIAAARGIALAAGRQAVGVSTLAAYAAPCIAEDLADVVVSAVDARHGHVYVQVFAGAGRSLLPASYMPIVEAVRVAEGQVHLAGSAAELLRQHWPADAPAPQIRDARSAPDITWVARLGAAAHPDHAPAKPLYLRAPDARPQEGAHLPRQ
ncbi:MAG: tRNA threonylcarbamoyladenosine biosynthesis protein TsaB [Variibacter sp.]|jgi:tRNA threonylcarbamoyladenosine biosynthesis protein TsaB|nr:tRNA threonylcarbamoyladenosine biosynthesis protein TsaB [Variibacter sp.]